jgi:hypothetical protein
MATVSGLSNCKKEEVPVIDRFVLNNMQRNLHLFNQASPDIDQAYPDALIAKQDVEDDLVTRYEKTGRLKVFTPSPH